MGSGSRHRSNEPILHMVWKKLPMELVEVVIKHVPFVNLLRFRAVCKRFTSPKFVQECLRQQARKYQAEIAGLMQVFDEEEPVAALRRFGRGENAQQKQIAASMEGSRLTLSALVADLFDKMSGQNGEYQSGRLTKTAVALEVLRLGARFGFGIISPDSLVLDDDDPNALWRWQVPDAKLLSPGARDQVFEQRRWRNKIGERIAALSTAVGVLRGPTISSAALRRAADCLAMTEDEAAIKRRAADRRGKERVTKNILNRRRRTRKKRRRHENEERDGNKRKTRGGA